jgi:hypothetical protein
MLFLLLDHLIMILLGEVIGENASYSYPAAISLSFFSNFSISFLSLLNLPNELKNSMSISLTNERSS